MASAGCAGVGEKRPDHFRREFASPFLILEGSILQRLTATSGAETRRFPFIFAVATVDYRDRNSKTKTAGVHTFNLIPILVKSLVLRHSLSGIHTTTLATREMRSLGFGTPRHIAYTRGSSAPCDTRAARAMVKLRPTIAVRAKATPAA